jgi:hypothetical protein
MTTKIMVKERNLASSLSSAIKPLATNIHNIRSLVDPMHKPSENVTHDPRGRSSYVKELCPYCGARLSDTYTKFHVLGLGKITCPTKLSSLYEDPSFGSVFVRC